MATVTSNRPRHMDLRLALIVNHAAIAVYATPKGLKLSTRGKVREDRIFLSQLTKGERRAVRKALHRAGLIHRAATPVHRN